MTVPTKGIHVQSTMRYLFNRLIAGATLAEPYPRHDMYNADANHFGGGSENMKLLYCVCGYVSGAQLGRERLINWYRSENGHGGGEPLTVSHGQLHLGGHCAALLHAHLTGDDEISILALNWLNIEYNLYSLCEVNGEPWTPGARGVMKKTIVVGENPTRGLFLRAVEGRKINKPNQYDLGAHCITKLNDQLRTRISFPIRDWSTISIQGNLKITRYKDLTFHAVFESLPIGGGGVQSAGYDGFNKWIYRDAKDAVFTLSTYMAKPVLKSIDLPLPLKLKPLVNGVTMPPIPVPPGPALWPPGPRDMAPGARKSTDAAYGPGLDVGALRLTGQAWEIMWPPGQWIPYDPGKHILYANMFARYGPGWSYGPAHNQHGECVSYFKAAYGRDPSEMERRDCEHSMAIFKDLQAKAQIGSGEIGGGEPRPLPPPRNPPVEPIKPIKPVDPVKPIDPVPVPAGSLTLSPVDQRTQELLSLLPVPFAWVPRFIMEALPKIVTELIKSKRRMEDRIAQRVIDALKK